ncbi:MULTISPECIES: envelope integrity protein Cei [unclassified Mycobacterium]|uniref:envelope integrity protein Cei n=1 Tax=unclassified Mycobacterium TaxID=2642494 RepID=UPI0007404D5C|nr:MULTISPECIES: envelope integrity protein Cei [unclassified Mycobacterium]KUH83110.1 hypothetical protein AU185_04820 [Mycobacterium sp. GA-0227b]KUH84479.1 hypothetical protein AU186_21740 [Mycobacterium sp. GA-1999]KUH89385.1 hypothetical protein AU187_09685 [Mycobacterium sp. IS-1556]
MSRITARGIINRRSFQRHDDLLRGMHRTAAVTVITAVIWAIALTRLGNSHAAPGCNPPPEPAVDQSLLGTQISPAIMADVAPAKVSDIRVRVLNAHGTTWPTWEQQSGGQAAQVASELRNLGFGVGVGHPTAANDRIYAGSQLTCPGQIRFGSTPAGRAAAATVWLLAPCLELLESANAAIGDDVYLALGTDFPGLARSDDIDVALGALRPDATTPPDPSLLARIHSNTC